MNLPTETKTLRGVKLLRMPFRNFSGAPTKYSPSGGVRSFNIQLPEDIAKEMEAEGWRVKSLLPRNEGETPLYHMKINIRYGGARPPRVVKVTPMGQEALPEDLVGLLDSADVSHCDLSFRPYAKDRNSADAVSAYLQSIYVHIQMDALDLEYAMDEAQESGNDLDEVVCDDAGVCYRGGVRINV